MQTLNVVVVDSTTIHEDRELAGGQWVQLLTMAARGDVILAVPEVVIREVARQHAEAVSVVRKQMRTAFEKLAALNPPWEAPSVALPTDERSDYQARLRAKLERVGARVSPIPAVSVEEVLARDLEVRKPFSRSGKGFRDTLIWETVLAELREHENATVLFVTANNNDFGGKGKLHRELEAELTEAEKVRLKVVSDLKQLFALPSIQVQAEKLRVPAHSSATLSTATTSPTERFKEAIDAASIRLAGEPVDTGYDEFGTGLSFESGILPHELDDATIEMVEPDEDTLDWQVYETYVGGTSLVQGSIEAHVPVRGYMMKSDAYLFGDEGQVNVSDPDWNDHMAEVSLSPRVLLNFQAQMDADTGEIEHFEFESAGRLD